MTGCSSDQLSDQFVEATTAEVSEVGRAAEVPLDPASAECAARRLTDEQAAELGDGPPDEVLADSLAAAIVECAGSIAVARSALASLVEGASETSIECAAKELDPALVRSLLAANMMAEVQTESLVELDVATALSLCLKPEELLDRS